MAARAEPAGTVDGLGDFKAKVHDSLFERLGTRLFEATNEDQLQSMVMAEIGALMDAPRPRCHRRSASVSCRTSRGT